MKFLQPFHSPSYAEICTPVIPLKQFFFSPPRGDVYVKVQGSDLQISLILLQGSKWGIKFILLR